MRLVSVINMGFEMRLNLDFKAFFSIFDGCGGARAVEFATIIVVAIAKVRVVGFVASNGLRGNR